LFNGCFLVLDGGGVSTTGTKDVDIDRAARLYATMKKYNQTANGGKGGEIVIAAWYITHPHTDHMGAFMAFTARYIGNTYNENVKLERVISYMFNVDTQTRAPIGTTKSVSAGKIKDYDSRLQELDAQGVHIYKAHVGQKYYIANATIEILYTYDLLTPVLPDYLFVSDTDKKVEPTEYPKGAGVVNVLDANTFTLTADSEADKALRAMANSVVAGTAYTRTVNKDKTVTYACGSTQYTAAANENGEKEDKLFKLYLDNVTDPFGINKAVGFGRTVSGTTATYTISKSKNDLTNSFSITCQITVKVDSKSYKAIWTGDVTCYGIETMNLMYGEAMRSDFVQVPHHGHTQMPEDKSWPEESWERFYHQTQVDLFFGDNATKVQIDDRSPDGEYNHLYTNTGYGYVRAKYIFIPAHLKQANSWMDNLPGDSGSNDSRRTTWTPIMHLEEEATYVGGWMHTARAHLTVVTLEANGTPSVKIDKNVISDKIALPQATDGNYTLIYSAQDLAALPATGKGKLAKDIYIQNPTTTIRPGQFQGELDGNGHTIYVSYTNGKTTPVASSAGFLFGSLSKATLKNFTLDGAKLTVDVALNGQTGVISAQTQDATITNVHVKNAEITVDATAEGKTQNVAGFCGNVKSASKTAAGTTTIENCTFHGTVKQPTVGESSAVNVGAFVGRVQDYESGATTLNVKNCQVLAGSEIKGTTGATGGAIGLADKATAVNITDTVNNGTVSATNYAGGLVGVVSGNNTKYTLTFNRCQNNGNVSALHAGGLLARTADNNYNSTSKVLSTVAATINVKNCVNTGNITTQYTANGAGSAGGVMGKVLSDSKVTVTSFYNSGKISVGSGITDGRIGSVIGRVGNGTSRTLADNTTRAEVKATISMTGIVNAGNVDKTNVKHIGIYIAHCAGGSTFTLKNAVNLNTTVKSNALAPGGTGDGNVAKTNVTDYSDKRFDTLTGARIRLSDTAADSGLRFDIVVDEALITALEGAGFTVKFGSLAAKADNVTGEFTKEAMDAAGKKYSDVSVAKDKAALRVLENSSDATAYGYTAALINITSYNTPYACVGYLELTNADGFSACIYTDYNATENARSVASVANAALEDNTVTFTAEQTAILNTFAGK